MGAVTASLGGQAHRVRERVDRGSDCWPEGAHGVRERVDGSSNCWPGGQME